MGRDSASSSATAPSKRIPPMTQYERIAPFEVVLKLRDQRRQRIASLLSTLFAVTSVLTAAFLLKP
jgi:hypothetical protein